MIKQTPRARARIPWIWFGAFCLSILVFISMSAVILRKPSIFSRVQKIELEIVDRSGEGTNTDFKITDAIAARIAYAGAQSGVKIDLVFARLVSDPQYRNGREILAQVAVPLNNINGERTYQFPAYERKPGNYEITLQSEGEIFLNRKIHLKNE